VSGDPESYLKRVQPVWFRNSYLNREDDEVGRRLRETSEMEGVVVRFVHALREHEKRRGYLAPDPEALAFFGSRSDQVRRFLSACTEPADYKDGVTKARLLEAFDSWARANHCGMGRNSFWGRIEGLGLKARQVKGRAGGRVFPLRIKSEEEWDSYDGYDEGGLPSRTGVAPVMGGDLSLYPVFLVLSKPPPVHRGDM
jgi:hypothetical protein